MAEVYCLIFAPTILARLNNSIGSEHEVLTPRCLICAYLGLILGEIFMIFVNTGLMHVSHLVNAAGNMTMYLCVGIGWYFRFRFIDARLQPEDPHGKRHSLVMYLPLALLCFISAASRPAVRYCGQRQIACRFAAAFHKPDCIIIRTLLLRTFCRVKFTAAHCLGTTGSHGNIRAWRNLKSGLSLANRRKSNLCLRYSAVCPVSQFFLKADRPKGACQAANRSLFRALSTSDLGGDGFGMAGAAEGNLIAAGGRAADHDRAVAQDAFRRNSA